MKIRRYLIIILACLVLLALFFILTLNRPISKYDGVTAINQSLEQFVISNDNINDVFLQIYSEQEDFNETFAIIDGDVVNSDTHKLQYHIASIGKMLTATLFYLLDEENVLSINDPITKYLDDDVLKDLFTYKGNDYKKDVTIEQLLSHTSGVACFFESTVIKGDTMKQLMIAYPGKYWSMDELVDFTAENQQAVGVPEETFNYSDTGYALLMLILEKATGKFYYEVFHNKLFKPLDMKDTFVSFQEDSRKHLTKDLMPMILDGLDISDIEVLSVGSSDGGIISTGSDLLKFMKAFNQEKIISGTSMKEMKSFTNVYRKGITYGVGIVQLDLREFVTFLPNMPKLYGGMGASGSFLLYDEEKDLYIIMNTGTFDMMKEHVILLIKILSIYYRIA